MLWNAVLWYDRPHAVVMGILELLELLLSEREESTGSVADIRTVLGLLRLTTGHQTRHSTLLFIRAQFSCSFLSLTSCFHSRFLDSNPRLDHRNGRS